MTVPQAAPVHPAPDRDQVTSESGGAFCSVAVKPSCPPVETVAVDGETTTVIGGTVKFTALLATPPTVTTTLPVVAPIGTGTTIVVELELVSVEIVSLKVTVGNENPVPKFVPVIVTTVPIPPDVGLRLTMFGTPAVVAVATFE